MPETTGLSQGHPRLMLVTEKHCPICPPLFLHRSVSPKPPMSGQPMLLTTQSFSMHAVSETDFQWPLSVGYCYPFRGKFPVQGSIMIPINADIIHAAKIHMPPAKIFSCKATDHVRLEILHYR